MRATKQTARVQVGTSLIALALTLSLAACGRDAPDSVVATSAAPADSVPTAVAEPTNQTSELPPDGQPLFDFLLKEIPALVEKVPCSCCSKVIGECYRGACPTTCGPCNRIGRDAHAWHKAGMDDDAIVAKVRRKYNIR